MIDRPVGDVLKGKPSADRALAEKNSPASLRRPHLAPPPPDEAFGPIDPDEAPKEGESGTLVGNWQKKDGKLVFLPVKAEAGSAPAAKSAE